MRNYERCDFGIYRYGLFEVFSVVLRCGMFESAIFEDFKAVCGMEVEKGL